MNFLGEEFRNFAVIVGVGVALWSLRTTITLARRKQSADLIFAGRNDDSFVKGIRAVRKYHTAGNIKTLAHIPANSSEDANHVRYLLNYFEAMSVGVKKKIYDEEILYLNYKTTLKHVLEFSAPYLKEVRLVQDTSSLYREAEWLADRWRAAEVSRWTRIRIRLAFGKSIG